MQVKIKPKKPILRLEVISRDRLFPGSSVNLSFRAKLYKFQIYVCTRLTFPCEID